MHRSGGQRRLAVACAFLILGLTVTAGIPSQADAATFGKTTVGGTLDHGMFSNYKIVHAATLWTKGSVTKLSVYAIPGINSPSPQALKAVIYADSGGTPGALLATGAQVGYRGDINGRGWFDLPFAAPVRLSPGTYWIGFITGATNEGMGYVYDSVAGARAYNTNSFSSPPSNPFGTAKKDSEQASIYATYTPEELEGPPEPLTISGSGLTWHAHWAEVMGATEYKVEECEVWPAKSHCGYSSPGFIFSTCQEGSCTAHEWNASKPESEYLPSEVRLRVRAVVGLVKGEWTKYVTFIRVGNVLWRTNWVVAGEENNPLREWAAYSGAHAEASGGPTAKHGLPPKMGGGINLVKTMDNGTKPLRAIDQYLYRYQLVWSGRESASAETNSKGSVNGSPFGDRLEMIMENEHYDEPYAPSAALQQSRIQQWKETGWKKDKEIWVSFAVYYPKLPQAEVRWSESGTGRLPLAQFHVSGSGKGPGEEPTIASLSIDHTHAGETPKIQSDHTNEQWVDEALKKETWYRFIYHFKIAKEKGTVQMWAARGEKAPFEQKINKVEDINTFPTTTEHYIHADMGGPRNEWEYPIGNTKCKEQTAETVEACEKSRPPTEVFYYDDFTFAQTKEAAEKAVTP